MNNEEKEGLKKIILERNKLHDLQGSRIRRLLKDPARTFVYYIMQGLAYIHPYKVKCKTLWGSQMSFYLPEGGAIYYYGFWEANLTNFFINALQEGDVFFDVGAHVGHYSMLASELVGNSGDVYSFEPTPRTFKSLSENAYDKKNVHVYNNAILNSETTIDFYDYGPKYSAFNTFKKRTSEEDIFKGNIDKISVKTISLDNFCKKNSIFPTYMKIDAEGSEYLILEAMNNILTNIKPLISIEVSTNKEWEESLKKSFEIFNNHGYICFEISLNGTLTKADPTLPRAYDNLIYIHPEKISRYEKIISK